MAYGEECGWRKIPAFGDLCIWGDVRRNARRHLRTWARPPLEICTQGNRISPMIVSAE